MKKSIFSLMLLLVFVISACASAGDVGTQTDPDQPAADEIPPDDMAREPLVIDDEKLYLAIIWHQHQPVYFKDPDTNLYQRPWVRVHASKDYLDMAAMLKDYPDIHATFNITPSLIRQLDDISAGT